MQTYSQFAPTGFDPRGLNLPDQQSWLVLPTSQTRDSGVLDRVNFAAAIRELGGESDTVEIHRFGHWACGWFEIIIVAPDTDAAREAEAIEAALLDYPVLDESAYSEAQWDEAVRTWERMRLRDRMDVCTRYGVSVFAARRDCLPDDDTGEILEYLAA